MTRTAILLIYIQIVPFPKALAMLSASCNERSQAIRIYDSLWKLQDEGKCEHANDSFLKCAGECEAIWTRMPFLRIFIELC